MSFLYLGPAPLKCIALFVPPCLEFQWSCVKVWEKLLSRIIFIIEKTWYILLYAVEYVKETYGSVIKSIHETSTEVPTIFCLFACLKNSTNIMQILTPKITGIYHQLFHLNDFSNIQPVVKQCTSINNSAQNLNLSSTQTAHA